MTEGKSPRFDVRGWVKRLWRALFELPPVPAFVPVRRGRDGGAR